MKAAYGRKYQDQKARQESLKSFMAIYHGIAIMTMRRLWGFGEKRIQKYVLSWSEMLDEGLDRYQEKRDYDRSEAVGNLYYASRRNVIDLGVDIKGLEKRYEPVIPESVPKRILDTGKPQERVSWLKTVDLVLGEFWYITILWLRDQYGFGAVKLTRFYDGCRERYSEFIEHYLKCTSEDDEYCRKFLKDLVSGCDKLGVDLMGPDEERRIG